MDPSLKFYNMSYKYCMVPLCENTSVKAPDKRYFLIPKDLKIRKAWCKAMRRDLISTKTTMYCCEDHFNLPEDADNYFKYNILRQSGKDLNNIKLRLKKTAVPHIFECQKGNLPSKEIAVKRKRLLPIENTLSVSAASTGTVEVCKSDKKEYESGSSTSSVAGPSSTVDSSRPIVKINILKKNLNKGVTLKFSGQTKHTASPQSIPKDNMVSSPLKLVPISSLREKSSTENQIDMTSKCSLPSDQVLDFETDSASSGFSWTQDDDLEITQEHKCVMRSGMIVAIEKEPKMLIGLSKKCYFLIKLLSESTPLPTIDILITLKKIKQNESFRILALHFGFTKSNISRIFCKSVPIIAGKMKELIVWPTLSDILKNLPISFRSNYSNVVSIIDCLEIEIEQPSNMIDQSLTWSEVRNCNTLKYLISSTPDGLVNFISEGYGGKTTDSMIVEDSHYLDCLPSNTAVMADRDFNELSHLLEAKKCILVRPPTVSSESRTKDELKQAKRVAALRLHVEGVIKRLREFNMLLPHSCVDYSLIPVIDEVVVIACGLINLQDVGIKN